MMHMVYRSHSTYFFLSLVFCLPLFHTIPTDEGNVFAFTGCKVTLNWNLGNKSSPHERINGWIVDTSGNIVLQANEYNCSTRNNDSSIECIVSQVDSQLIIFWVIMNAMTNHSGNYTMWYRKGMVLQNIKTEVVILDKPQITANGKPVLLESLTVMCNTSYVSDCLTYYWKRNGIYLNYTSQLRADSSKLILTNVTEMDILSNVTCEIHIRGCGNVESKDYYNCSGESQGFKVEPFPSSNPDPNNENRSVHHDSNDKYDDSPFQLLGVGLVVAALCMTITGILICVTQMRKYASRRFGTRSVHMVSLGPKNRVAREMLNVESHNRSLTVPTVQDNACWIIRRSGCPNGNRKSMSLQTLMDHTQDIWNPFRQSLSLQTMLHVSHAIKWRASCKLQNTGSRSLSLPNIRPASFDQEPNDEQYSTIDEAKLTLYHCIKGHNNDGNLQDDHINNEARNNDYDYATLPAL